MQADPLVGQLLDGRYRIESRIGVGGMGKVYRATREKLGKLVAIKTLEVEVKASERAELVERFTREAQATAAIRHENVVEIIDFGQTEDCIYFVMELLEGYVLADLIGRGTTLEPARLVPIAIQVAKALHAAHVLGTVHRDVKPSNIFISPTRAGEERVKVVDFGLAKVSDGIKLTRAGMVFGTASYMSPEQARGTSLDARTDIYSLGCVLFEALAGRPPFVGEGFMDIIRQHLEDPVPSLAELRPELELPAGLEDVMSCALAKDPDERFSTMEAVARALGSIEVPPAPRVEVERPAEVSRPEPASSEEPDPTPAPPQQRAEQRHPVLALLALLYITQSHVTDDDFAASELKLIIQQLHAWKPMTTMRQIKAVIAEAQAAYDELGTREARLARCREVTVELRARLSEDQRRHVLGSMWRIAGADGRIIDAEREFISETVALFNAAPAKHADTQPIVTPAVEPPPIASPEPPLLPTDAPPDDEPGTALIAPMFETGPLPVMDPEPEPEAEHEPEDEPYEPTRFVPAVFEDTPSPFADEPGTEILAPVTEALPTQPEAPPPLSEPPPIVPEPPSLATAPASLSTPAPLAIARSETEPLIVASEQAPASPPRETEFGFSSEVVSEHFERSRQALAAMLARVEPLSALAAGPLERWRESASVLGLESAGGVREQLGAIIDNPEHELGERRTAALLLLTIAAKQGPEQVFEHATRAQSNQDHPGAATLIDALELGGGPSRDKLLLRGHAEAPPALRPLWLGAVERQAIDPGPEILAAALASDDAQTLAPALRLLCVHAGRSDHQHELLAHLFAPEPEVRSAALAAGLLLGLPQAPILAGQTTRLPGMFTTTCLHALAAPPRAFAALLELASQDHSPSELDLALALSGRPRAIDSLLARHGARLSPELLAGLRFVTGFEGSGDELEAWWAERREDLEPDTRHILGKPASATQLLAGLRQANGPVWSALRLELLVRSKGELCVPARGLPDQLLGAIEAIEAGQLDWLEVPDGE